MNNYLNKLKHKINCLPESYANDILEDYKNYFYEGSESGKTEKELISELGDVEYIGNNIIAEYFIENSDRINGIKTYASAVNSVGTLGFGILNLMIMIPIVISALIVLASLYFTGAVLLVSPVFLIVHIINPQLPISFGTDIAIFKVAVVSAMSFVGIKILSGLNKIRPNILSWSFMYIVKSIKFKAIKFPDIIA